MLQAFRSEIKHERISEISKGHILDLLDDEAQRREMGGSAKAMVQAQVGASRRYAERIVAALKTSQAFQRDKPV